MGSFLSKFILTKSRENELRLGTFKMHQSLFTSRLGLGLDKIILESTNPFFPAMNRVRV